MGVGFYNYMLDNLMNVELTSGEGLLLNALSRKPNAGLSAEYSIRCIQVKHCSTVFTVSTCRKCLGLRTSRHYVGSSCDVIKRQLAFSCMVWQWIADSVFGVRQKILQVAFFEHPNYNSPVCTLTQDVATWFSFQFPAMPLNKRVSL